MDLWNLAIDKKDVILLNMDSELIAKLITNIENDLQKLRDAMLEDTPVFPEAMRKKVDNQICLNCDKKLDSKSVRGVHVHCHRQIMRSIEDGEMTDGKAISIGLLLPKGKTGRKPLSNALRKALERTDKITMSKSKSKDK